MKLRLLLISIGLIFVAAACGPEPQIRSDDLLSDSSLLTGDPCGPPCWRNIIPGETTWQDALTFIEDDPTLEDIRTQTAEDSDAIVAAWKPTGGEGCCQMYSEDGRTVSFIVLQTTPVNTLGQVIDEFGEPDYVIGETVTDSQGLFNLFYTEIPMIVYAFVAGEAGEIGPNSEIVGFGYMTNALMDDLILNNALKAWMGYQSFQAYADREFVTTPIPENEE